jgi:transcriptional regulator with XRE-family HTH domain
MRGEAIPEDYIPGIVLSRLKMELDLTFEAICADVGIPVSTLSGNSIGSVIGFPSRIKKLADYFRDVHGLDYVDADYLLSGGVEDQEKIEAKRKELEQFEVEDSPFERIARGEENENHN